MTRSALEDTDISLCRELVSITTHYAARAAKKALKPHLRAATQMFWGYTRIRLFYGGYVIQDTLLVRTPVIGPGRNWDTSGPINKPFIEE